MSQQAKRWVGRERQGDLPAACSQATDSLINLYLLSLILSEADWLKYLTAKGVSAVLIRLPFGIALETKLVILGPKSRKSKGMDVGHKPHKWHKWKHFYSTAIGLIQEKFLRNCVLWEWFTCFLLCYPNCYLSTALGLMEGLVHT